ncbi:MAG: zf-HC2 domain-containing protein [Gemmatimonadetes bacterium]|nr:zf-HC2 domain-containing protein [Gemmatimonadota bacterium]
MLRLWEYIDGELDGDYAARVRAHLASVLPLPPALRVRAGLSRVRAPREGKRRTARGPAARLRAALGRSEPRQPCRLTSLTRPTILQAARTPS